MRIEIAQSWVMITLIISITNGQKTSVCSPHSNQDEDNCEIQYLKQQLALQSAMLQTIWNKITKLDIRDCSDLLGLGHSASGVYEINQPERMQVYCDMETDGGGWTVLLNRQNADVDFDRSWADYKHGFGDKSANHWLGNDVIFSMTSQRDYKLRIDLSDWEDEKRHAVYSDFRVGSEIDKYQLSFASYLENESNVGDSLAYQNGAYFTTKDSDNDDYPGINCARLLSGAFWYRRCYHAALTTYYGSGFGSDNRQHSDDVIAWFAWHGVGYSLKTVKMMTRPMN